MPKDTSEEKIVDAAKPLIVVLEKLVKEIMNGKASVFDIAQHGIAIRAQHAILQRAIIAHREGPEQITGQPIS